MPRNIAASVVVGYEILITTINQKYIKALPEQSHLERRFDPKTGEPAEPVKIVTKEAGDYYIYNGHEYSEDEQTAFLEDLAMGLRAQGITLHIYEDDDSWPRLIASPHQADDCYIPGTYTDSGGISTSCCLDYHKVKTLDPHLEHTHKILTEMGLEPVGPAIYVCAEIG